MTDTTTAGGGNRALLAQHLEDRNARALLTRIGDETNRTAIADAVTRAALARVKAIEQELADADTRLA